MIYLYKCDECQSIVESTSRGDVLGPCPWCEDRARQADDLGMSAPVGTLKRKFQVAFEPPMQEHWNRTVNMPISDQRQFNRELRKAGDQYTERTGMETDYQPLTQSEVRGMMTMEGMDTTNRERVAQGLKPIEV